MFTTSPCLHFCTTRFAAANRFDTLYINALPVHLLRQVYTIRGFTSTKPSIVKYFCDRKHHKQAFRSRMRAKYGSPLICNFPRIELTLTQNAHFCLTDFCQIFCTFHGLSSLSSGMLSFALSTGSQNPAIFVDGHFASTKRSLLNI